MACSGDVLGDVWIKKKLFMAVKGLFRLFKKRFMAVFMAYLWPVSWVEL